MAVQACEEYVILKEWAPLTDLFEKLPCKSQIGLFLNDLKLSCVDVLPEYIVLGTKNGIVYLYDRKRKDMQRLRCETNAEISVVKIIPSVDFMLACGCTDGKVCVFTIPKIPPDTLPESLKQKNKQVERYSVDGLHKSTVTALEWSKGGMKLFSGDTDGIVVATQIDFYMHLCKSSEILNEAYEVTQLSYYQQHLLVSTTYRSIICQQNSKNSKWDVCQVGKKDRKVLGKFGGIFYQNGIKPTDVILYCARPGLRIWISDIQGTVQRTLLMKDILHQESPNVLLLNPLSANLVHLKPSKESSFGPLFPYLDNYLVTYNNDVLYVLHPKELKIVASVNNLRSILDISINKDEIFILEGERSLIRIAISPESTKENEPISTFSAVSAPLETVHLGLSNAEEVYELTNNVQNNQDTLHKLAEQAQENNRKLERFSEISKQKFDENILYKHGRHKKSNKSVGNYSVSSTSSDEKNVTVSTPTVMNTSFVGILPDCRSPNSIENDIIKKEKMLADILNFDNVIIDKRHLSDKSTEVTEKSENKVSFNENIELTNASIAVKTVNNEDCSNMKNLVKKKLNFETNKSDTSVSKLIKNTTPAENMETVDSVKENIGIIIPKPIKDIPACKTLPENWKVEQLSLTTKLSESPENDWELL